MGVSQAAVQPVAAQAAPSADFPTAVRQIAAGVRPAVVQTTIIGINTPVAGQAEPGVQAQGIGFAIAIDTARPIADQLIASGHAIRPFLGISFVALNPAIAAQLGTQATSGAVVVQVAQGSPAAASPQPRDVITRVDGKALSSDTDLARAINTRHPGDVLSVSVVRADKVEPHALGAARMTQILTSTMSSSVGSKGSMFTSPSPVTRAASRFSMRS